jgi:hypothetical protein
VSAVAQRRPAVRPKASSGVVVAAFVVSVVCGVALSASIAWGHPILAARWGLLWRLALWAIVWAVAVGAALRLPSRTALTLILGAALALRLAALAGPPTTSDDLYRYSWDGRVQAAGVDPYAQPPASLHLASLREGWLWPTDAGCAALHRPPGCTRINRPAERTIYPPVAEAWFAAVYRFGGVAERHKLWQVAGLLTDMATVGLLVVALGRVGRDPRWVALYALSPIPVLEIVNNGHVDGLAIFLVVGALTVAAGSSTETRRDISVGLLLGLAALVKLYPALLVVAVFGLAVSRPRRSLARAATAATALAAVAYLPHVAAVGWRVVGYLPGYLKEEHYNQGGRFLLAGLAGLPGPATTALAIGALLGTVGWVAWRRPGFPQAVAVLLGALFLTTTPVQPWYATSLVAVAALTAWPWWVAVALAGYPYFFAVILDYPHAVGLGRASFGTALVVVAAAGRAASLRRARLPPAPLADPRTRTVWDNVGR